MPLFIFLKKVYNNKDKSSLKTSFEKSPPMHDSLASNQLGVIFLTHYVTIYKTNNLYYLNKSHYFIKKNLMTKAIYVWFL